MDLRAGFRMIPTMFDKMAHYQNVNAKRANWARLGFFFAFLLVAGHGAEKVVCRNEIEAKLDANRNSKRMMFTPYWIAGYSWRYNRV